MTWWSIVQAGSRWPELGDGWPARSALAFDSALPGRPSAGSLAPAPSGPRRLLRGTVRDLLIGVTFVRADGVVAKAGGRVVKNVAGYDLGKLLTGADGTLGLVTEADLPAAPQPRRRAASSRSAPDADGVPGQLQRS